MTDALDVPQTSISISQSLYLSVHTPEGQRDAPMAEHCPAQLAPSPQATCAVVKLFGWQHGTMLVSLVKLKELSKNSTDRVFPGGKQSLVTSAY